MKKASTFFTEEEKAQINRAVTDAEKKTSGEIVPVLATDSGRYDRAEDIGGLWFACIVLSLIWVYVQGVVPAAAWSSELGAVKLGLVPVLAILIVSFMLGAALTSRIWFVRHLFTSRKEMRQCVQAGAQRAFYEHKLRGTLEATGVLIYVSLYERMVYVLGDEGISEKLSQDDWDEVCGTIIKGIRDGQGAEGLCSGIAECGALLTEHFPIREEDENELPNELVVID